jgi:hypothetical protein
MGVNAQVTVNPGAGSYTTLEAAFTAINAGTHTGAITIDITGNTIETISAVLNASGSGAASYTSIGISPSGGATRTISGNMLTPLIDLNGADNVIINGINTGGNALVIDNQSIATTASTVRFINDASNNTIQNCTVLGSSTAIATGTIVFSTADATLLLGNDNNTISNCTLDGSGANLPSTAILCSGTATAGQENSNITISNNNIANFFSATIISAGIAITAGGTNWSITNNKLYQTATRIYTTANTHKGIAVLTGAGYNISGNIIGYANASGTGTTNMVGNSVALNGTFPSAYTTIGTANATRYIAINGVFTAGGAMSEIQNNTIAGFALYTSSGATTTNGIFCGIAVTAGNVNIGTTAGNTIGATTGTGSIYTACSTTGGMMAGIFVTTANSVTIQNNTIGALDAMGTTAATTSGGINGINIAGAPTSYNVSGNTIGNSTLPNLRMGNLTTGANLSNIGTTFGIATGTSMFNGILSTATTAGTIGTAALPNTIRNAAQNSSGTTASIRGITAAGIPTISYNLINNLSSQSTNVALSSTLLAGMGIFLNSISGVGAVVNNNTIHSLSLLNATTTGTNICGVAIYANTTNLFNNNIYNITNASTSVTAATPGTASGFFLRQPGGIISIYNNMVSLGNGQTTNTAFNGIWQQNSAVAYTLNAYHNTINIEGTVIAGAQPSICHNRGSYSVTAVNSTVNAVNNIYTNTRSGGTGKHYAIANNYLAAANPTGWAANASNYNVLNAAAANVGYWGVDQTFAGWQAASASDVNSFSGITVNYVNSANDLHLNMGLTATVLESGGTNIVAVATDYDGQSRPGPAGSVNGGALAPDLGADEFDGVYLDISSPTISYTPLVYTCDGSVNRTLTTSITDASGVPTSGVGLPVLYWKINAGTWSGVTGTYVSGSNYTFSFGAGAILNDVVSYYIVAQDNMGTPNIGAFPLAGASGFTVNPPAATTPPTTPSSYTINNTLTGTFTVGTAGVYPTLTAAVAAYNVSCLSGPVTFSLIDATYPSETFPITINANPQASAVNTLTIQPATGVSPTISGTSTSSIINLNGADFVTIDGGNGTGTNSICPRSNATRTLTITQTNVATTAAVVSLQTTVSGDAATNNKVMNCNIVGNSNTTTLVGINISGTAIGGGAGGTGNHNNQVVNNAIQKVQYGIFSSGASIAIKNQNNIFNLNDLTGAGANAIGIAGIVVIFEDGATVQGNNIANMVSSASADVIGISVGASAAANTLTTGAEVTNSFISYNTINNLVQTNTFSAVGINIAATATGINTVANNVITNVFSNGTSGDLATGIYYGGGAGTLRAYYNTVHVTGATLTGGSQPIFALAINGAAPNVDIQNNILMCTGENGANSNTGIGLAYTSTVGNYANLISNNNDIFVSGTTGAVIGRVGSLTAGTTKVTLADWQTETGRDGVSLNTNPVFVSGTDFHLVGGDPANVALSSGGTPISVTTDFDCVARSATTPTIGAYENTFLAINQFESTNGFKAYPNPVSNILNIEYTSDLTNVFVYNMLGQQVLSRKVTATSTQIDMSGLNAGTYLVKVEAGTVSKTLKVFKR